MGSVYTASLLIVLLLYLSYTDDYNRVELSEINGDAASNYINASYIDVSENAKLQLSHFLMDSLHLSPIYMFHLATSAKF